MRSVLLALLIALAIPTPAQGAAAFDLRSRVRMPIDYDADAFLNAGATLEALSVGSNGTRNLRIVTREDLNIREHVVGLDSLGTASLQSQAIVHAAGNDLGQGCGVPIATLGILALRGGYIGQAFTCADFIGRFGARASPDSFPASIWNVTPRMSVPTDEGMMDTVFSEQFQMGFADSSPWVLLPGLDLNVELAMAACEVGLTSTDCRRILTPPGSPSRIFPYGVTDDDDGFGVYMGVTQDIGNFAQTIIRYELTSQAAPTTFIDQTDVPMGSAEAVGEMTGASFSLGVGAIKAMGPDTQLQQLLVEFDDMLLRIVGEGEGVPGSPGLSFGTSGFTFSTPPVGESTVGFDALVVPDGSANAKRGAFVVSIPFEFGAGGGSGAGPAPPPAVVPIILPGEVLPDGTVDSATVAAVSGDVVLSVVRYQEGGTDLYAIYPVPEPTGATATAAALVVLLTLRHKTRARRKGPRSSGPSRCPAQADSGCDPHR